VLKRIGCSPNAFLHNSKAAIWAKNLERGADNLDNLGPKIESRSERKSVAEFEFHPGLMLCRLFGGVVMFGNGGGVSS